jgi:hypothetical protein
MTRGSFVAVILISTLAAGAAQAERRHTRVERAPSSAAAPSGYDGNWTIEATTTVGACAPILPSAVTIQGNRIVQASGGAPWGYIEGDGVIVARFSDGGRLARAHGSLRGGSGAGAWSSSTDYCGGTWRAARSGASAAR